MPFWLCIYLGVMPVPVVLFGAMLGWETGRRGVLPIDEEELKTVVFAAISWPLWVLLAIAFVAFRGGGRLAQPRSHHAPPARRSSDIPGVRFPEPWPRPLHRSSSEDDKAHEDLLRAILRGQKDKPDA